MLWQPPRELREFLMTNRLLGQPERYRRAALAKKYLLGLQYDGRRPWLDESVPLSKRKPKIQIPLYAQAVRDMDAFVWGGDSFPAPMVAPTRQEGVAVDPREVGPALDHGQAALLTTFLQALVRAADLPQCAREFSREALVTTSAAIVLYTQGGYLCYLVVDGKDCTPTWCPDNPRRLQSLDISYRYKREDPSAWGSIPGQQEERWYRRTIDEQRDITFKEVVVKAAMLQPVWEPDPEKSVEHNLGFCPAHWVRTFPESSDPVDGRPFIDPILYPLLEDIDYTVSQRSRATAYGTDPQGIRTGVDEGQRKALEKNPGRVWDLPNGAEFKFAEIQGAGADQASKHLDDLTHRFREAVGVVMTDPRSARGDVSGRVLELLHRPMITLAGDLRHDLGERGYQVVLNLALRIVATEIGRGRDLFIPGAYAASDLIAATQRRGTWVDYPISLDWPPFLPEAELDLKDLIAVGAAAHAQGYITTETAAQKVARHFGVKDVAAEVKKAEQQLADARAIAQALNPKAPPPAVTATAAPNVEASPEAKQTLDQSNADAAAQAGPAGKG